MNVVQWIKKWLRKFRPFEIFKGVNRRNRRQLNKRLRGKSKAYYEHKNNRERNKKNKARLRRKAVRFQHQQERRGNK